MTKVDGWGNRYELVKGTPKPGHVCVRVNNRAEISEVEKDSWDKWEQVRDSKVEQKGFELD